MICNVFSDELMGETLTEEDMPCDTKDFSDDGRNCCCWEYVLALMLAPPAPLLNALERLNLPAPPACPCINAKLQLESLSLSHPSNGRSLTKESCDSARLGRNLPSGSL